MSDPYQAWLNHLRQTGVVAVVVIDDPAHSERLVEALLAGGIDLLELTLRTPSALESMRRIRQAFPGIGLGAGTVLRPEQVSEVRDAGADFGVAPGLNPRVVAAAQAAGLPFAPGVFSPSEIEQAMELGCRVLKFFPAATEGQSRIFQAIIAPYAHLGLQYIPLGGLTLSVAEAFLRIPSVAALGGSWIASRELIRNGDWNAIRANAQAITNLTKNRQK
ncbi:MAG: bifunctional 4-hydroxy-2-oxoglutarate aldolase/2-dehydro-3-deoxy-phosphogluconate aldolase [Pedosphaera sp.]|nr:bifunctional 4-hydroxy-2-oxoglutarate aldolase/2-dehydro-3-deoxy-phosphogluconate aldolase [Pedosphaera sp.]